MSGALLSWYSLPDLSALAERGAVLEGKLPLSKLERLRGLLSSSDGSAAARLSFRLHQGGVLVMNLQCEASLELVCQRCLEPMSHEVREQVDFAIAENEASLAGMLQGTEFIALEGDRIQPLKLIEDELIVSLPLVPMHGDEKD